MHYRQFIFCFAKAVIFLSFTMASTGMADQKIIQQETLSFDKCLNVIAISENKLSISPKIIDEKDQKRVAIFTLNDGELTITCDGVESTVIVSTNKN